MRRCAWGIVAFAVTAAALAGGCGDGTGTVSGEVTVDDKPLAEGLITYVAADGKTAPVAVKVKDGKYSASVPAGSYKVQVSAQKPTGQKREMLPGSPPQDVLAESLPGRYNVSTELHADVKAGANKLDWPLKGQ